MPEYKLVPTTRGPDGWYTSWSRPDREGALASAREFFEDEDVPVLVVEQEPHGFQSVLTTVGLKEKRIRLRREREARRVARG